MRLMIEVRDPFADLLAARAERERRSLRDQASILLERALDPHDGRRPDPVAASDGGDGDR